MKVTAAIVASWLVRGTSSSVSEAKTLATLSSETATSLRAERSSGACRDVTAARREALGCPASAANMCECRGYPASSFSPETVAFEPTLSQQRSLKQDAKNTYYAEGTCGYADMTCDLKWAVVCCDDAGLDLGAESVVAGDVAADKRRLQTTIDFETADEFCARNGYPEHDFDPNRIAYPGEGFVGLTGYLSGTCGNVLAESDDVFATCCCFDATYCCPQGADSDDCASSKGDDLLDLTQMSYSYSYSYSYVGFGGDVPPPSPADACPTTEELDTSKCLEHGERDYDCCASAEFASCEAGFVNTPGEKCGDTQDMYYTTCCYPEGCTDSPSWHKNGEPSKDCAWVAEFVPNRCDAKGEDRSLASYSCPKACDSPCIDSMSWYKAGEPSKNCAWVSTFPKRCEVKGEDGTSASYACPHACAVEAPMTPDSDTWYKNGEPSKNCAWVSGFSERCDAKGWDRTFAWYSCPVACGVDSSLVDDRLWFKDGEPSKTCTWVSLFAEARCSVIGWSGDTAAVGCPLACSMI